MMADYSEGERRALGPGKSLERIRSGRTIRPSSATAPVSCASCTAGGQGDRRGGDEMNREFDGEQPKMRILLVEDDAMEREKLLACLEQAPDGR